MKLLIFVAACFIMNNIFISKAEILYLNPGETHRYIIGHSTDNMQIYCHEGRPKYIVHVWQTVCFELNHPNENYYHYFGDSPEKVEEEYKVQHASWSLNLFSWKIKHFKIDPFSKTCIGIVSNESYSVHLNVIRIDCWKLLMLLCGIVLFFYAPKLSGNAIFYYLSGISFGVLASFLIFIYFISKLFPRRPMMYGFIVGGWTVGVYALHLLWDNIRSILTIYKIYVIWYALISGFISFIVCYRWGPVSNPRTKNLIQWSLQGVALTMIFLSSHFQEASMACIIIVLLVYNVPQSWISKIRSYWRKRFPPRIQLLSNDQYHQQGVLETSKALDGLRTYCRSPQCNQWNTILKLKDAKRFATFIESGTHFEAQEVEEYYFSNAEMSLDNDEDEDDSY